MSFQIKGLKYTYLCGGKIVVVLLGKRVDRKWNERGRTSSSYCRVRIHNREESYFNLIGLVHTNKTRNWKRYLNRKFSWTNRDHVYIMQLWIFRKVSQVMTSLSNSLSSMWINLNYGKWCVYSYVVRVGFTGQWQDHRLNSFALKILVVTMTSFLHWVSLNKKVTLRGIQFHVRISHLDWHLPGHRWETVRGGMSSFLPGPFSGPSWLVLLWGVGWDCFLSGPFSSPCWLVLLAEGGGWYSFLTDPSCLVLLGRGWGTHVFPTNLTRQEWVPTNLTCWGGREGQDGGHRVSYTNLTWRWAPITFAPSLYSINRITHTSKNITFRHIHMWSVKIQKKLLIFRRKRSVPTTTNSQINVVYFKNPPIF